MEDKTNVKTNAETNAETSDVIKENVPKIKGRFKLKHSKTNDELGRPSNYSYNQGDEVANDRINFKHWNDLVYEKDSGEKDTTYSSIWVYRKGKMVPPFVDTINLENPYFSEFNPLVSQNITNYWCDENDVVIDPYAGRTRGIVSGITHRKYYGFEIAKNVYDKVIEVIEGGEEKFDEGFKPIIYNDDSFNIDKYPQIPVADLIFSCPPYWNLEKYPSCPGQLSDIDGYDLFLDRFQLTMEKCCDKLKDNGFICLVIGDFRKDDEFISLDSDVISRMKKINNIVLWDKIILQNTNFGQASRKFGAIKHKRITSKVSEYLLVFKKVK
jgi:DNA modification methylase